MAWRWEGRNSPRPRRSLLHTPPLTRSPLRTPPRGPLPYSPLKTPPMSQTPPLLRAAVNHSPLRTPPLFSNISPPPVSHTPPLHNDATWRTEPNFHYDLRWISGTLSPPSSSPRRLNIMTPTGIDPTVVPTTMREVEHFLTSAWNTHDTTSTSEYSRKLSELHRFYTTKMWEIEDKEEKALAESLSSGDQPGPSGLTTLNDCLLDAEIKQKYSELKQHVKEETVQAILKLNAKSPGTPKRSHQGNSSSPQQRRTPQLHRTPQRQTIQSSPTQGTTATRGGKSAKKRSPQKPSRTVWDSSKLDILNKWYDEHSDKPYPTKKEKEELAKRCKMNVKQVSTWFNNKRYRSNCTLTKKGKGKGKGSK